MGTTRSSAGRYWHFSSHPERQAVSVHSHDRRKPGQGIAVTLIQGPARVSLLADDLRELSILLGELAEEMDR